MPDSRPIQVSSLGLSPEEVASRSFVTVRRGLDPDGVRRFLDEVASQLRAFGQREAELRELLVDAERRASSPTLDEATLSAAVGSETAKVLQAAHAAAQEVVTKAESRAEALIAEASTLHETRAAAAEAEAERLLSEGRTAAERLVEQTKEECRSMLAEARSARREILADLAERRRSLHLQLEQLRAAKDALASVVDGVADEVTAIRTRLATSEEVAREAAEDVAVGEGEHEGPPIELFDHERIENAAIEPFDTSSEPEVAGEEVAEATLEGARASLDAAPIDAENSAAGSDEPAAVELEADDLEDDAALATDGEPDEERSAEELEEGAIEGGEPADPRTEDALSASAVDELFARIRATRADEAARDESTADVPADGPLEDAATNDPQQPGEHAAVEGAPDEGPQQGTIEEPDAVLEPDLVAAFERRDALLASSGAEAARALKRVLRSEQNELLDAARRVKLADADELLAGDDAELRIVEAVEASLIEAWRAGHAFADGSGEPSQADRATAAHGGGAIARELAGEIVRSIRGRLLEGVAALREPESGTEQSEDGLGDLVGVAYREWKGAKVDRVAADYALASFSSGTCAAAAAHSLKLRWVLENAQPCSDCDDNAISDALTPGESFPTGQTQPPLHPGCRCLLVVVAS